MSKLFQTLEYEAFRNGIKPRSQQSMAWFRKQASQLKNIDRKKLMREDPLVKEYDGIVGSMNMFFYDPKHKATLPYYDKFPLAVVVGPAKDGFYGLNLHYLPLVLRAKFLDALLDVISNNRYNDSTKFKVSYQLLKKTSKMKYYKPCFKHYLNKHVKSHFARVPAPEWEIATFLPTASWAKSKQAAVFADSRGMI